MADLTSLYKNKPKRDFSIQACADCINKIAIQYPNEFKQGFFTDYFDIAGGTQPPKSTFINEPKEGYIKFLQIRDFSSDSTPTYIPISKNNKICSEKDLVLGRYGASVGKILTGKSGAYNVACAKIIFLEDNIIDRDFLFYWLHSTYFQNFLTSISRSAQGGFNKNDLSRVRTQFPNLETQIKLTSIIKQIDVALLNDDKITFKKSGKSKIEIAFIELVEKFLSFINEGEELTNELTHQLSLVKKLRQQLLQDAVQGKLVEQNPKDEPASQLLKKIKAEKQKLIAEKKLKKEKDLPPINPEEIPFEIPENWVWCRLGEICTKVTDGFHNTPKKLSEGKIYISATHIREDGIKWSDCLYVSVKDHQELFKKAYPKKGEILITNRGAGCSTPVIIDIDEEFSFQNAALIGFNQELVCNKFLFYFILKSRDEIMRTFVNGGLQPMLSNVVLSTIPIPLPPLSEQNHIVQKLDELMQYCNELEASIKESESQNEKLLQQVLKEALRRPKAEIVK